MFSLVPGDGFLGHSFLVNFCGQFNMSISDTEITKYHQGRVMEYLFANGLFDGHPKGYVVEDDTIWPGFRKIERIRRNGISLH